ncbi:hypothetical protein F4820DRAFT_4688 [Hypoxylon rubiginosum]|uniref:Uncharacterized protein n=1 Tax=Hypoxylon rubiginosum TaxID=110542 RepID=A0ACB9ZKP1_9PEZI|nr:hypothetical protein F4820DRAFT_4688 [Hypoxylon rubiginosum]
MQLCTFILLLLLLLLLLRLRRSSNLTDMRPNPKHGRPIVCFSFLGHIYWNPPIVIIELVRDVTMRMSDPVKDNRWKHVKAAGLLGLSRVCKSVGLYFVG